MVHTVHAGLDGVDEHWTLEAYPTEVIAAISNSQVATIPTPRHSHIRTIYHGCNFAEYDFSNCPDDYLGFIGRMGSNKNPAGAIAIAKSVDMPIVLVGQPQTRSECEYFNQAVKPHIDGVSVVHLGILNPFEKSRF